MLPFVTVRFLKSIFFILVFLIASRTLFAQTVDVEIKVIRVSNYGYLGEGRSGSSYRFYLNEWNDNTSRLFTNCIHQGINGSWTTNVSLRRFTANMSSPTFRLLLVTHNERKEDSDYCTPQGVSNVTFNKPDLHETYSQQDFDLRNLQPGVYSNPIVFTNHTNGTTATAEIQIRYSIPQPSPVIIQSGSTDATGRICSDKPLTLKTTLNLPRKDGLKYVWEYYNPEEDYYINPTLDVCYEYCHDGDYCDECESYNKPEYWELVHVLHLLDTTATDSLVIENPLNTIFEGNLEYTQNINFRVKVISTEIESPVSSPVIAQFLPPSPNVSNLVVTYTPSCKDTPTGEIRVSGVKGYTGGTYRYILREGASAGDCKPNADNTWTCAAIAAHSFTGDAFTISNVPRGEYTLLIANQGGDAGVCYTPVPIVVPFYEKLAVVASKGNDVTCYGGNDGEIVVTTQHGHPNTLTFNITPALGTLVVNGRNARFTNLPPGTYIITASDNCHTDVAALQPVTILQAPKLTLTQTGLSHASCNSPANGVFQVSATVTQGTYDAPASGQFEYVLYKNGTPQTPQIVRIASWSLSALESGNYEVWVRDAAYNACNIAKLTFTINAAAPIPLPVAVIQNISCPGEANGMVRINNMGGNGKYRYLLYQNNRLLQNTTDTTLANLAVGNYQLIAQRLDESCADAQVPVSITIAIPDPLTIQYTKADIRCFGEKGSITITQIQGGTQPYKEQRWYQKINNTWAYVSGLQPTSLSAGTYRMEVIDNNNCQAFSDEITILEPTALQITRVSQTDIRCIGESGSISMTATGGTNPLKYEYSIDNGATYQTFTQTTPFAAGAYLVRVVDANGCVKVHPSVVAITAPDLVLDFTYALSNYNGYNISCFGGNNGFVTLTPTGGNGHSYSGYTYALDGGMFQTNSRIEGITAGSHTLSVKDGRGCIVSKSIVFTQTSEVLALKTVRTQNVVCAGDQSGVWEVIATGGVGPFQYSLDTARSFQSSGTFTNLTAQDYLVTVKDANGCTATLRETILSLYPPILLQALPNAVSCFGGTDGRIDVTVSGGTQPYAFLWQGQNVTTKDIAGLPAGTYTLRVTDGVGCSKDVTATITQPSAPVALRVQTLPVCVGQTNGKITVNATGGTAPYQYSVDNGSSFQVSPVFASVGVGTYAVWVKDANGCTQTTSETIVQRNEKPVPNFLIATRQYAQDTLVIKEVSVPLPDSITWTFDPRAVVIDANASRPKIRFDNAGSYALTMTGHFSGCDYPVTKTLIVSPFDPDAQPTSQLGIRLIEKLDASPNPSNGTFEVKVSLLKKKALVLVVLDVLGTEKYRKTWDKTEGVVETITIDNPTSGFYILRAISDTDAREIRMIITK